jgi:hypothetical protein
MSSSGATTGQHPLEGFTPPADSRPARSLDDAEANCRWYARSQSGRTWAQSGPNARDWPSRNACLRSGRLLHHARWRRTNRSPPIWGSRGREFKSRQPDDTLHAIRPSRTCKQQTFLPPSMTPSGGAATSPISASVRDLADEVHASVADPGAAATPVGRGDSGRP